MNQFVSNVVCSVTRFGSKVLLKVKSASPEILIGGGIVLIVSGAVLACKNTPKAIDAVETCKTELDILDPEVNKVERRREKAHMVAEIGRAYAVPVALGVSGIALILTAHGIMKKRNGALIAAYNALQAAFDKYRERVRAEEGGIEKDHKYMFGGDSEHPTEDFLFDDDDVSSVNKQGLTLACANSPYGPYGFEFNKFTSQHWSPHALSNLNTIRAAEDWGTRQLKLTGHLFLNDVLKYLGMDEVPWGQLVGWIRGSKDGDSYVEVLATEVQEQMDMDNDFWKKPIFLEMNCDGVIWDKI